ncbi:MAG: glucose 1-dehydrogenase [Lautropia sp.]
MHPTRPIDTALATTDQATPVAADTPVHADAASDADAAATGPGADLAAQVSPNEVTPLRGKVAIVTGASSGIGQAIAVGLAADGARVAVDYRNDLVGARRTVAAIEACGGEGLAVEADVSHEAAVARMFDETAAAFGRVDIVVPNAGIQQDAAIGDMTLAQWQRVIDVNLTGAFLCAREAIRVFRRQSPLAGETTIGNIVFVGSVHQVVPWAGHVNYAASKGGLTLLMKSLAQEVAEEGIRVNAVAPGAIRTPINRAAWDDDAALARLRRLIPLDRIGEAREIADAVRFLVGIRASYVVGTTLLVDGGMSLYPAFRDGG